MNVSDRTALKDDVEHAHRAARLSPDVLLSVFRLLTIPELVGALLVCKKWRHTIDSSSVLWATVNLDHVENYAFSASMLQPLLLRSREAPLHLRFTTDAYGIEPITTLCELLEPHLDRLRSLTVRARYRDHYNTLFSLFEKPLPMLRHVDISYNTACYPILEDPGTPPDGLFILAPQLRSARWDLHRLPEVPNMLSNVTYLQYCALHSGYKQVFSLFPRLTALRLDHVSVEERIQSLPLNHPLRSLELHLSPLGDLGLGDPWAHLKSLGLCRIAALELHNFPARTFVSAARDSAWHLESLAISCYASADATLAFQGSSECRMIALTGDVSLSFGPRGTGSDLRSLMDDRTWAHAMTSLTLSLAQRPKGRNMWRSLPWGALPALLELSLICGTPPDGEWATLLDPQFASGYGVLDAPRLRVLRLLARRDSTDDDNVIETSALTGFILDHVRVEGGPVPLLRVSWFLRLSEDEADMATLRAVVGEIEDTV